MDDFPQRMYAHLGCIDHQVCRVDDGFEQLPLEGHGLTQVDVVTAHRVLAPRFGKTPQQFLVTGDEEDHFALDAASSELIDELWNRCDLRGGVACVQADR